MPPKRKAATKKGKEEESEEDTFNQEDEQGSDEDAQDSKRSKPTRKSSRVTARKQPKRGAGGKKKKGYKENSDSEEEVKDDQEEEAEEPEEEAPNKKSKGDSKEVNGMKWHEDGTLYYLTCSDYKGSDKIVGFDMDSTLVEPKSGAKFPRNRTDWVWLYPEIPDKLKQLHKDGYGIVIFTNQAGIEKNNQKPGDITGKILDLGKELGIPLLALVAAATDVNRKPNTTMWKVFEEKMNNGVKLDISKCLYVGDAAGRQKDWKKGAKKDFSCSDRAFAINVGVTFKTPEEFFFDEAPAPFEWDSSDPKKILDGIEEDLELIVGGKNPVPAKSQEMIVLVGRPASGKSTFAKKYLVPHGYEHVNQDTLKTKEKCIKAAREAAKNGKSVVIDNTNPSIEVRSNYVDIAKEVGIPIRCFVFQTDPDLAYHLNFYREKIEGTRRVPDVGYNQFKSKFQEPSTKEGFEEIKKINWVPDFPTDNHRRLFLERT